jgi:hypothetical protein
MAKRQVRGEMQTMAPVWRRSLPESGMRKATTSADVAIVVVFLVVSLVLLVVFGPSLVSG